MALRLDVPFKGQRDYLHSTDILTALIAETGADRELSLKFTKLLRTPIEALPAAEDADPASAPARFKGKGARGPVDLVIRPTGSGTVERRVPYDEDAVSARSVLQGLSIEDANTTSASTIERIVALNKRLINDALRPGKRLLFISVTLSHLPPAPRLHLEIKAHAGNRIFRSAVMADGAGIGDIVFYGE